MSQNFSYADVIVGIQAKALDRTFQYHIPEELSGKIDIGSVVELPFGARTVTGYVVGFSDSPKVDPHKIRDLQRPLLQATDEESRLTGLAVWMRDRYGSTMIKCLRTVLPEKRRMAVKMRKTVCLPESVSKAEALDILEGLKRKNQKARVRLYEALVEERQLPYELVQGKLHVTGAVVKACEALGLVEVKTAAAYRNPSLPEAFAHPEVSLNEEQRKIVSEVRANWDLPGGKYLIHGVTGSGKTEVYIGLIAEAVSRGEQAILLIPEIALTYQTLMRFYHRFGDRVSVIHSQMTDGERSDQFERARNGEIDVMIGPRSALFTPFPKLGIIVIDEEHEESYRSGQAPRYHARDTAIQRAKMEGAKVILGSATPSLEAYYAATLGVFHLFSLKTRARASALPEVEIVDLRQEKELGNSLLSQTLLRAMDETLSRGDQMMLFLNRRGVYGFVNCRDCGETIKCPHCDVALSLHGNGRLCCHYCGFSMPMVERCPSCNSILLRTWKAGTESVEQEVRQRFPAARVLRMDRDSTKEKDGQLKILSSFASHEADILIGTQMIVKGHDFPDVTLVGILAADMSLNIPDFRAAERTFQLLTQAAGRAGRGQKAGRVLIQTYQPGHYAVRLSARQDYEAFFKEEIRFRENAGYPPAGAFLVVHAASPDAPLLEKACGYLRMFLLKILGTQGTVLGPADESISKIADVYRKVLYVKSASMDVISQAKDRLERYIAANSGFQTVEIQFDLEAAS